MPTMNLPPSTVEQYTYGDLDLLLTWIPCQGHPLADLCALGRVCVVAGHSPKLSQRLFSRNLLTSSFHVEVVTILNSFLPTIPPTQNIATHNISVRTIPA